MKNSLFLISFLFFSAGISAQSPLILNWDKLKSPIANSENLITLHNVVYKSMENKIKNKYWKEDKGIKRLGGMGYRLVKSIVLDNQVDWLTHIHHKHVFGHGFRYREFGLQRNSFKLNLFPPFGGGAGFSRKGRPVFSRRFGIHENLAMHIGGMEAASILSNNLRNKWIQSGKIHYRESLLFLASFHDYTANIYWIILIKDNERLNSSNRLEFVNNYLDQLNDHYGFEEEGDYQLTISNLGVYSTIDLLNVFHLFAAFTYLNVYLVEGDDTFQYPMFRLGETKWLPSVRFGLTPFGSEFIIENFLKTDKSLTEIRLRLGDSKLDDFYGGGVSYRRNWTEKLNVNIMADFWVQPSMELGGEVFFHTKGGLGGRFIAEINQQFKPNIPIGLFGQVGYKTTGFYPGEILQKGPIARLGISFRTNEN